MTIAQAFLSSIYTGKDNALNAYQIGKLEINKDCLARYNKHSDNGISLTICDIVSTEFTSKVSKSGLEKGIKPVVLAAGEVLIFNINAQSKKDGQPSEEVGAIDTIAGLLKSKEIKEGEVFFLRCDFGMIPPKGFDPETLDFMAKKKDSDLFKVNRFDSSEELTAVIEALGFNVKAWSAAYEALSGSEFKEMQAGYTKKSFSDAIEERLLYLEKIVPNEQKRILTAIGHGDLCQRGEEESFLAVWQVIAEKILTNI